MHFELNEYGTLSRQDSKDELFFESALLYDKRFLAKSINSLDISLIPKSSYSLIYSNSSVCSILHREMIAIASP